MNKERPILFSAPMVQAILDERKTVTRRTKGLMEISANLSFNFKHFAAGIHGSQAAWFESKDGTIKEIQLPYQIGDILWVRESSYFHKQENKWFYKATDPLTDSIEYGYRWKPGIHMPRLACRLFLEVLEIKVERLHAISEKDAISEGVESLTKFDQHAGYKDYMYVPEIGLSTAKQSFQSLWSSINGEQSWETNPWVWVITFVKK